MHPTQFSDGQTASGVINAVPFASGAIPGDCNSDDDISSADITAVVLEIFDGDGTVPADASGGSFSGTTGCDANQDGSISAADITCTVLIIFKGPDACLL